MLNFLFNILSGFLGSEEWIMVFYLTQAKESIMKDSLFKQIKWEVTDNVYVRINNVYNIIKKYLS